MKKAPRILFFDIETAPIHVLVFGVGHDQHVGHEQIVNGDKIEIITICYKFLGEKTVRSLRWDKNQSSKKLLEEFSKVVSSSDCVIGHNADGFDIKHINSLVVAHNLKPFDWPMSFDTLKKVRQKFRFISNRLDYLGNLFLGEGKSPMSFSDWKKIKLENDKKTIDKMVKYCKKDVNLLEGVFLKIKDHLEPVVNMSLFATGKKGSCRFCGMDTLIGNGRRIRKSHIEKRLLCTNCGRCDTVKMPKTEQK